MVKRKGWNLLPSVSIEVHARKIKSKIFPFTLCFLVFTFKKGCFTQHMKAAYHFFITWVIRLCEVWQKTFSKCFAIQAFIKQHNVKKFHFLFHID